MKKLFLFLIAVLCIGIASAQTRTVSGTVVSAADGEPVIGATVTPAGSTSGVVTDMNGQFSLPVSENVTTLNVSYVGMEPQEVTIPANGIVNVKLADKNNVLDEVMVVAFGTAKKSAFTGSAAVVNSESLEKHVTTNVANALVGQVPGLQMRGASGAPGASQGSMNIRGIASISAGTDPLIIVDGSPYPASLSNIPQGDVESITVLKDAASAALYGARGAAGVILITTKKGSAQTAKVSVDAKWGSNTRALQRYDVITDPGQYYEAYYNSVYNYYANALNYNADNAFVAANNKMLSDLAYNVYTIPTGQTLIGTDGRLNPNATLGRTYSTRGMDMYMTPDDWYDTAYKSGLRQEYNVAVNGGYDKGSYYLSLGYLDEDGIIDYSSFKRFSGRFKGDFNAKSWLKFGINLGYVNSTTDSNPNLNQTLGSTNLTYYTDYIAPIYPVYVRQMGENGVPFIQTDEWGHEAYDYGVPGGGYYVTRPFLATGNPLGANRYNKAEQSGNQLSGTFTADVRFTEWLSANITSNVIWGETEATTYQNPYYGPAVSIKGSLVKSTTTTMRTNNIQTLNFDKNFGQHSVNALIGHEYYRQQSRYLGAEAQGGFSPDILEINAFANRPNSNSYKTTYNVEGYFIRGQYDYDSKYFASVSYRRDASSIFDKAHRWGDFWSVGAAWIINKDFLTDKRWIDMLKLKVSVGQQGNDDIGNWAYTDLYQLTIADKTTMSPSFYRIGNPNITWETTTNFNVGAEFGFFNNRLNGSVDFYYKKVDDLLFWLNIPESGGSRGYYDNIGDISNTGVEVTLNGSVIKTRDFDWSINLNLSHNKTKILTLPESKKEYGGFSDTQNNIGRWYEEGKSLYNIYMPKYAGPDPETGEALYYTDSEINMNEGQKYPATRMDGTTNNINLAPSYEMGSSLPKLFGGFGTTVTYKGFDASVTFDYQLGGTIYDTQYAAYMTPASSASAAGQNYHKDYINSWSATNKSSNIPRWQYGDQYTTARSDRFLTSARYLNFQSFVVGYTLPKFCKEISSIRIYAMGENLCFWSARKGLDPRYAYSGLEQVSIYAPVRNISGGVQVSF